MCGRQGCSLGLKPQGEGNATRAGGESPLRRAAAFVATSVKHTP